MEGRKIYMRELEKIVRGRKWKQTENRRQILKRDIINGHL
jgi:hypothetical protein